VACERVQFSKKTHRDGGWNRKKIGCQSQTHSGYLRVVRAIKNDSGAIPVKRIGPLFPYRSCVRVLEPRLSLTMIDEQKFHVFVKFRALNALDNIMRTNPIVEDSGWNFSFWFAVSSPLLGVLLAFLALAIFCR
jgi:hypothetical protein